MLPAIEKIAERLKSHLYLWVALAVAIPRLAFMAAVPGRALYGNAPTMLAIADNLVSGNGYRDEYGNLDGYFSPMYPALLAAAKFTAGKHMLLVVKLVQVALDVVTAVALCSIMTEFFTTLGVLLFGAAFALHPLFIHYNNNIDQEPLLISMVVLSVVAVYCAVQRPSRLRFVVAGFAAGLATLTKGSPLLLPFLIAGVFWLFMRRRVAVCWTHWIVFLCAYLVTLVPWSYRNYLVFHRFSVGVGGFGSGLWWGSDPRIFTQFGEYRNAALAASIQEMSAKGITLPPNSDIFHREHYRFQMAVRKYQGLLGQPAELAKLMWMKFTRSLYASEDHASSHLPLILLQVPTVALAMVGLWRLTRRARTNAFGVLVIVVVCYFYLIVSATMPMVRYFIPALPLLLLAAVVGLSARFTAGVELPTKDAPPCC